MTAVLFVIAAFVVGLFGGALVSAARDYYDEQGDNNVYRDELVRQWREGYADGKAKGHGEGQAKGYAEGWTTGRVQLLEEQQAKASHPTSHPLGEVIRIEHARKDELDDLWGRD
jgi:hypothetical protein